MKVACIDQFNRKIWHLQGNISSEWNYILTRTMATDALMLKHQAISIHNAD